MKIHYRNYDYPKPVDNVLSRCTRHVTWANSTDDYVEITCATCQRMVAFLAKGFISPLGRRKAAKRK